MEDVFEWKGEIKFKGTAAEFNRLGDSLTDLLKTGHVTIDFPEWLRRPRPLPGLWPVLADVVLGGEMLKSITEGMPRVQINYIRDIRGGIRTPHLHVGDDVVLLDRARFKTVVAEIARDLAARRAEAMEDYVDVTDPITALTPIQLP